VGLDGFLAAFELAQFERAKRRADALADAAICEVG